jgi:hypothetical protein
MAFFSATENRRPCRARRAPTPGCGAPGPAAAVATTAAARSPFAAGNRSALRARAANQRSTDRALIPNFVAAAAAS